MSYHPIFNAKGVQPCLRYKSDGNTIGRSCSTCIIRDGEIQTIDGLVVLVRCSRRKMHDIPPPAKQEEIFPVEATQ